MITEHKPAPAGFLLPGGNMKALFLTFLIFIMTGCAALDTTARVPVQYATLKVIENSGDVTAQDVLDHTQRIREVAANNAELNIAELVDGAIARVALSRFDASDQMLIMILFNNIEQAVVDIHPDSPLSERRVKLLTLLDWIDQAARLTL